MDMLDRANERLITELNNDFFLSLVVHPEHAETLKSGEDMDLYLCRTIYPVLLPGLEALSREVERYMREGKNIDYRTRSRFNPCRWLAQYLMRNHPSYNPGSEITRNFENETFVKAVRDISK